MIRHMVALRFRHGTPDATKAALYADLNALGDHIDGIVDFRSFANISVELAVVRGFNDLFWFDFRDLSVRDAYLADPAHQAVGARLVAELEGGADGVFVCDIAL
jgi:Stress responsive A/B Barrel Domain